MAKPHPYSGKGGIPLLQAARDTAEEALTPGWTDITGKPATFPPSAHTHPPSEAGLASIADDGVTVSIAVKLEALGGPVAVAGSRADPEQTLKSLLQALEDIGLITDTSTA